MLQAEQSFYLNFIGKRHQSKEKKAISHFHRRKTKPLNYNEGTICKIKSSNIKILSRRIKQEKDLLSFIDGGSPGSYLAQPSSANLPLPGGIAGHGKLLYFLKTVADFRT